ncbi:hypothetical protein A1351_23410 [Methylosinus sp. R-45379]|nr:hypothetical protein A1351_23410 [Methylosinus sp. R-45379]
MISIVCGARNIGAAQDLVEEREGGAGSEGRSRRGDGGVGLARHPGKAFYSTEFEARFDRAEVARRPRVGTGAAACSGSAGARSAIRGMTES